MNEILNIDGDDYEVVPDEARILTEHLFALQSRLGIPENISNDELNDAAWGFIVQIFNAWRVAFPQEFSEWFESLQDHLKYERPVKQAVKAGGFIPISYPYRFYQLLHIFLPNIKTANREFTKRILTHIPELKKTNYRI